MVVAGLLPVTDLDVKVSHAHHSAGMSNSDSQHRQCSSFAPTLVARYLKADMAANTIFTFVMPLQVPGGLLAMIKLDGYVVTPSL